MGHLTGMRSTDIKRIHRHRPSFTSRPPSHGHRLIVRTQTYSASVLSPIGVWLLMHHLTQVHRAKGMSSLLISLQAIRIVHRHIRRHPRSRLLLDHGRPNPRHCHHPHNRHHHPMRTQFRHYKTSELLKTTRPVQVRIRSRVVDEAAPNHHAPRFPPSSFLILQSLCSQSIARHVILPTTVSVCKGHCHQAFQDQLRRLKKLSCPNMTCLWIVPHRCIPAWCHRLQRRQLLWLRWL